MKTLRKQSGFFDFGIGLGLLAIFGGTAAVVTTDETKETIVVEQQIQFEPTELPKDIAIVQAGENELQK